MLRERLGDLSSVMRFHIVMVAMTAALVFSWLATGDHQLQIALIGGVDWLLINLLNRITDLEEDAANDIRGTKSVARHKRAFVLGWLAIFVASFAWTAMAQAELIPWRFLVQGIGLGYSIAFIPTPSGLKRFKDLYFLKNFMSSVLFVLTVFVYPMVAVEWRLTLSGGWEAWILLIIFFVSFELTYEILYDMRDLEGDRLARVPTYPVVYGLEASRRIIDGLLLLAFFALAVGLLRGMLGLREGLMLVAPIVQFVFYRARYRRGLTRADCIWLTHLGTALLLFYLAGNALWIEAGLPANIFLFGG